MLRALLLLKGVAAAFQREFIPPPFLRNPAFEVEFYHEEPSVSPGQDADVVNINLDGSPLTCVLPSGSDINYPEPLPPLKDLQIIAEAQAALSELDNTKFVWADDDVWAWIISFNSSIVQFLPTSRLDNDVIEILPTTFHVMVGMAGTDDGYNLKTATPVVIGDQHMMMVTFANGTECNLTKAPRQTRLFFTCDPDADEYPLIRSVEEPFPCLYEMIVGTDKLCSMPEFREPQAKPNVIKCGPIPHDDHEDHSHDPEYQGQVTQETDEEQDYPDFEEQGRDYQGNEELHQEVQGNDDQHEEVQVNDDQHHEEQHHENLPHDEQDQVALENRDLEDHHYDEKPVEDREP